MSVPEKIQCLEKMADSIKRDSSTLRNNDTPTTATSNIDNSIADRKQIYRLNGARQSLFDTMDLDERAKMKCGLFIKGFSPDLGQDEIINYFANYGTLVWFHFGRNYLLLDYSNPDSAKNVLSEPQFLGPSRLFIRYREPRVIKPMVNNTEEETEIFLETLKPISDLNSQVEMLVEYLQGNWQSRSPMYHHICRDLYNVLLPSFPRCIIHPFGSTITGLSFKQSDIDVFASGIKPCNERDSSYLFQVRTILFHSQLFSNIIVIAHAKIPILKCVHRATNISCDINLRNMLGVHNSKLIKYYTDIDPKVKKLMIILKCWAKRHRITGQNHLLTNYSISMMTIFFLQQPPFNLPSVSLLQKNLPSVQLQDFWNGRFCQLQVLRPPLHKATLISLLTGFFTFYSKFDYENDIMCPYLGRTIKKAQFATAENIPEEYTIYKQYIQNIKNPPLKVNSCMCLQDPFEHSRNTTSVVSGPVLHTFLNCCIYGKKLCEEGESKLIYNLMMEEPPQIQSKIDEKTDSIQVITPMSLNVKYIEKTLDNCPNRSQEIQKLWFGHLKGFILIMLRDLLRFEVEEIEINSNKTQKGPHQSDVYDTSQVRYKCAARFNFWQGRKVADKNKQDEVKGIIEREKALTDKQAESYKNITNVQNVIEFELYLRLSYDPVQAIVKLKKILSYKKTFKSFLYFFNKQFKEWFEQYEKEMNSSV